MTSKETFAGVDRCKVVAAVLVIAIHVGPLSSIDPYADFLLTRILARLAVPFFFVASGFFFFRKLTGEGQADRQSLKRFVIRVSWLYLIAILLYLPLNWYKGTFEQPLGVFFVLKELIFEGTFYHLWYLPALIIGVCLVYLLYRRFSLGRVMIVTGSLYLIGLLGDSYYGMTEPFLRDVYASMFLLFDYTRNGLFFAPVFLAMGAWIGQPSHRLSSPPVTLVCFSVSLALLFTEGILLKQLEWPRHDSMYIALLPAVYFLFQLLLRQRGHSHPYLRPLSTWMYILHPLAIVLVRGIAKLTGLVSVMVANSLVLFCATTLLTVLLSFAVVWVSGKRRNQPAGDPSEGQLAAGERAWAEINLAHLLHNLREIKQVLPQDCAVMAVVKADAYGHGSLQVASRLYEAGVRHFAVAEMNEGIHLRKHGVKGEILILGYTSPNRIDELLQYDLTQTVINSTYGEQLERYKKKIKVQIKIDTGMHRLGESHEHVAHILPMYQYRYLRVTGTYSHLAAASSLEPVDINYTRRQQSRFAEVIQQLKANGVDPGNVHLLSSYGILNYPQYGYDMVRPGICLYGLLSTAEDRPRFPVRLRPVLSLKAKVTLVKAITANNPIGYGRCCITEKDCKIAVVSIGYADGLPRSWGTTGGYVLVRGQKALITGAICMDQLMVDVTHIDGVTPGDTVTVIGRDGDEEITAEQMAQQCNTISNEIVSRIGSRVRRVYHTVHPIRSTAGQGSIQRGDVS